MKKQKKNISKKRHLDCKESINSDILLLYPPANSSIAFLSSIPALAGYLIQYGYKVDVLDSASLGLNINDICEYISKTKPEIIGVSIPFTSLAKSGYETIKIIKERFPNIIVICGGVHPTLLPEEFVDCSDFVCIGEGERTLKEFLDAHKKGKGYRSVSGLAYNHNGQPVTTEKRKPLDLDTLPFPSWESVNIEYYHIRLPSGQRAMPISTSRGCPFSCNFCSNWILSGRIVRYRNLKNVIEEIKYYREKYKITSFSFRDETFTLNRNRVIQLCEMMQSKNISASWWCQTRADLVDKDLLIKMKDAGCIGISIGVETGDEFVLNKIGKGVTLNDAEKAFKLIKEVGIHTCADFIIGHPWDTPDTILRTIHFAISLDIDLAGFALATPYPKTALRDVALKQGTILTNDWSKYVTSQVTYVPPSLKGYDLFKIKRISEISFYSQNLKKLQNKWRNTWGRGRLYFLLMLPFYLLSYIKIKSTGRKVLKNLNNCLIKNKNEKYDN